MDQTLARDASRASSVARSSARSNGGERRTWARNTLLQRASRQPEARRRPSERARTEAAAAASEETALVVVQSRIADATLRKIAFVVDGVAQAARGSTTARTGEGSSTLELRTSASGLRGAVYFELWLGEQGVPLVTEEEFYVLPGGVHVLTIDGRTRVQTAPAALAKGP